MFTSDFISRVLIVVMNLKRHVIECNSKFEAETRSFLQVQNAGNETNLGSFGLKFENTLAWISHNKSKQMMTVFTLVADAKSYWSVIELHIIISVYVIRIHISN